MEVRKINKVPHRVFKDKREFEEYFLIEKGSVPKLIPNWRLARQGDWTIADDGGVVQILKHGELPHHGDWKDKYRLHKNGWIRTVVGTFIQDDNVEMDTDFEKHPNRYTFSKASLKEAQYRRKTRKNLSNKEWVFVTAVCSGKTIQESYEEAFGPHHDWYRRALFLLKRERVLKKVKENVKDKLNEKFGGDILDFIFDHLKELVEKTKNDNVKLSVLKELSEWSGEKEKDKQITTSQVTLYEPFKGNELAKIEAQEIKVLGEVGKGDEVETEE